MDAITQMDLYGLLGVEPTASMPEVCIFNLFFKDLDLFTLKCLCFL